MFASMSVVTVVIRRSKSRCTTANGSTLVRVRAARMGRPRGIRSHGVAVRVISRDRHCLHIYELSDPFRAELAAKARALCPAKGQSRIGGHHAVDENHPGFKL